MKKGIDKLYSYKRNFIILGLTGRTGSGCTTTADILSEKLEVKFPSSITFTFNHENDRRKYEIVKKFAEKNWQCFVNIRVKDIITAYILENTFTRFKSFLSSEIQNADFSDKLDSIKSEFDKLHKKRIQLLKKETPETFEVKIEDAYQFHFEQLPTFTDELKSVLSKIDGNSYTRIYQKIGNNLRSSGSAFSNINKFNIENSDLLVKKVDKLIQTVKYKFFKENKKCYISIDSLRNPFEIYYLKEKYSNFYLIAINTLDNSRIERLREIPLSDSEITNLDNQEYPKRQSDIDFYISQNIQKCIELADIHINNPQSADKNFNELRKQILNYFSLLLKPGLIPPTPIERVMQLAYSAKLNSGCISRQVGAAVTDKNFSIKAIGWNNVPQNQVPCILRSAQGLIDASDNKAFSKYEQANERFREFFGDSFSNSNAKEYDSCGNNISFCFKDVQNDLEGEKNQVHTRSLHAEENAFLQLSKYGNSAIFEGLLFTTASPCELCSKKAYQLGIKKIFFIDPYPGIATSHILEGGSANPDLELFTGAVGPAYFSLYQPLISYKDELSQAANFQFRNTQKISNELKIATAKIKELEELIKNK